MPIQRNTYLRTSYGNKKRLAWPLRYVSYANKLSKHYNPKHVKFKLKHDCTKVWIYRHFSVDGINKEHVYIICIKDKRHRNLNIHTLSTQILIYTMSENTSKAYGYSFY